MSPDPQGRGIGPEGELDLDLIHGVLRRLGRSLVGTPLAIASGRNHNWRIETDQGLLFFRLHRHSRSRERIELGLAAMLHAASKGIPVAAPVADSAGKVLFGEEGRFASVYPWVEGLATLRRRISAAEAALFGRVHGQLHRALSDFEHPSLQPATELTWDRPRSLGELEWIQSIVDGAGEIEGLDRTDVLAAIAAQIRLLEGGELPAPEAFAWLPRQPIHGDIHEGNVMLAGAGGVAAVVDWDMVAAAPTGYEVIRALDFTGALDDPATVDAYLAAYTREAPYRAEEARAAVALWASSTIHNTWALRARFLEGDRRVDPFIPAHRARVQLFADDGYRRALEARFAAFAAG